MEQRSRWAVRAMDCVVAVLTRTSHGLYSRRPIAKPVTKAVAFGAQARSRDLEKVFVHRAMRIVAVQAVLAHRRVFEQERSALLGMALVAIVVDRIRPQQPFGEGSVRIMTIRAHHFAFTQRHMGRTGHLRAPILVALEA